MKLQGGKFSKSFKSKNPGFVGWLRLEVVCNMRKTYLTHIKLENIEKFQKYNFSKYIMYLKNSDKQYLVDINLIEPNIFIEWEI